jgi:polar amino acid transport system substrate-binding protein
MKRSVILSACLLLLALATACAAPAATPAPPVVQTVVVPQTVAVAQTVVVKETAVPPTAAPTTAPTATSVPPTPLAQLPADAVQQKGKLLVCSDFPYPPMEFYDENGNPTGADVELGNEIGTRLGLQTQWVNSVFDTIIAAVTGGKCDIIMSDQNVTVDRSKQITQMPYFKAGQSMVVAKGNPQNINTPLDTCGTSVAAESGTTEVDYLNGTGDYDPVKGSADLKGKGLNAQCTKAGKKPVIPVVTVKDSDALLQLQSGKVSVYFADTPVAAYYVIQHPDQFQLVGSVIDPILVGVGMPCGQADCTGAPLTPLGQAVKAALLNMMSDGTYLKILTKYQVQDGAVTPADVDH